MNSKLTKSQHNTMNQNYCIVNKPEKHLGLWVFSRWSMEDPSIFYLFKNDFKKFKNIYWKLKILHFFINFELIPFPQIWYSSHTSSSDHVIYIDNLDTLEVNYTRRHINRYISLANTNSRQVTFIYHFRSWTFFFKTRRKYRNNTKRSYN